MRTFVCAKCGRSVEVRARGPVEVWHGCPKSRRNERMDEQ